MKSLGMNAGFGFPNDKGELVSASLSIEHDDTLSSGFKFGEGARLLPDHVKVAEFINVYCNSSNYRRCIRNNTGGHNRYLFETSDQLSTIYGKSYGLLGLVATLLAFRRPDLFRERSNSQTKIGIVATGNINGNGCLKTNANRINAGGIKEKIKAVLIHGGYFDPFETKYFIMPDQKTTVEEKALLKQLEKGGWIVEQIQNVSDLDFLKPDENGTEGHNKKKEGKTSRKAPFVIAGIILVGIIVYAGMMQEPGPVIVATVPSEPHKQPINLTYNGSLKIHARPVLDGRILDPVSLGHTFFRTDSVELEVEHNGDTDAYVAFVASNGKLLDGFRIESGTSHIQRYNLAKFADSKGKLIVSAVNCKKPDCVDAKTQLLQNSDMAATESSRIGSFSLSNEASELRSILQFNIIN